MTQIWYPFVAILALTQPMSSNAQERKQIWAVAYFKDDTEPTPIRWRIAPDMAGRSPDIGYAVVKCLAITNNGRLSRCRIDAWADHNAVLDREALRLIGKARVDVGSMKVIAGKLDFINITVGFGRNGNPQEGPCPLWICHSAIPLPPPPGPEANDATR